MPQGKGTYGSKVGRPPKKGKKKYYGGGRVDPFSSKNPEGVVAKDAMEAIDEMNTQKEKIQESIPTTNAMERSQSFPDTEKYDKGGKVKSKKVDITDVVKETEKSVKSFEPSSDEYADVRPTKAWPWSEPTRRTYGDIEKENPTGGSLARRREGGVRKRASVRSLAKKALKGKKK